MKTRLRTIPAVCLFACVFLVSVSGRAPAQGENVELLGRFETPLISTPSGDQVEPSNDVWGYSAPDGTELAILGTFTGTRYIDVTDPSSPVEVAYIPGSPSTWRDMKTFGPHAYAVNENSGGLQIVSLEDPLAPALVRDDDRFFSRAHNLFIDESTGLAYIVGADETGAIDLSLVLDLSDPEDPALVTTFEDYYVHDIYVRDGVAYAAAVFESYLALLDVSSLPAIEPISIVCYERPFTHNAWLSGDGRYVVTTDEQVSGIVRIFDVQDPAHPFEVGSWSNPEEPTSSVHNVTLIGDRIFASWYTAGLQILDISDPSSPQRLGWYDTSASTSVFDGAWGVYPYADSGNIYLSDAETGLYVFRFEDRFGALHGRVLVEGEPAAGVRVDVDGDERLERVTDEDGRFLVWLEEGSSSLAMSGFTIEPGSFAVEIERGQSLERDFELTRAPSGRVEGLVRLDGVGRSGIEIELVTEGDGRFHVTTDAGGRFAVPHVPAGGVAVRPSAFGFHGPGRSAQIGDGETRTLDLEVMPSAHVEDFEDEASADPWRAGVPTDNATGGIWERVDPIGTGCGFVQPEDDRSPEGSFAWVTGNGPGGGSIGENDVDGGVTTLVSPLFDLSGLESPVLAYHRWYSNDAGADPTDTFSVDVSSDGGLTWVGLENLHESRARWERVEFALDSLLFDVSEIRLRFIARDLGQGSIVEAGIDDLEIYERTTDDPLPQPDPPELELQLGGASPNPFPGTLGVAETVLRFGLASPGRVQLDILDVSGRIVRRLLDEDRDPGAHRVGWNGKSEAGRDVPAGVYFQRLRTGEGTRTGRVVVIR